MNYQELQDTLQKYLYNRRDLADQIPTFISLSEAKMYRILRCWLNEVSLEIDPLERINPIPPDLAELKSFSASGRTLEPVTDLEMLNLSAINGQPEAFARVLTDYYVYPTPDDITLTGEMIYWATFAGTLVDPDDTNPVLTHAPDLYLYGALVEAMPYLVKDERAGTWKSMYEESLAQLNYQSAAAEVAGGVNAVRGAY